MTKLSLLPLAALFFAHSAFAVEASALAGTWQSADAANGALSGTIVLKKDGYAALAPDGYEKLEGTWQVSGPLLTLTMPPHGVSRMQVKLSAKKLTLTYDNGFSQSFVRIEDARAPRAKKESSQ